MSTIHYEIETTRKELEIRSGMRNKGNKEYVQRLKEEEKCLRKIFEELKRKKTKRN